MRRWRPADVRLDRRLRRSTAGHGVQRTVPHRAPASAGCAVCPAPAGAPSTAQDNLELRGVPALPSGDHDGHALLPLSATPAQNRVSRDPGRGARRRRRWRRLLPRRGRGTHERPGGWVKPPPVSAGKLRLPPAGRQGTVGWRHAAPGGCQVHDARWRLVGTPPAGVLEPAAKGCEAGGTGVVLRRRRAGGRSAAHG